MKEATVGEPLTAEPPEVQRGDGLIHHEEYGTLNFERLLFEIGRAAYTAPMTARFAGHLSMQQTMDTYVHPRPSWSPERLAAWDYIRGLLLNDTNFMVQRWFPRMVLKPKGKVSPLFGGETLETVK